jgi:hypothetical protein
MIDKGYAFNVTTIGTDFLSDEYAPKFAQKYDPYDKRAIAINFQLAYLACIVPELKLDPMADCSAKDVLPGMLRPYAKMP